jgi:SpoVK/Ycf46/Vps4 family AAA+-type ATPase
MLFDTRVGLDEHGRVTIRGVVGTHGLGCATSPSTHVMFVLHAVLEAQATKQVPARSAGGAGKRGSPGVAASEGGEDPAPSLEEALDELQGMIGLDAVKAQVATVTNLLRVQQERRRRGLTVAPVSNHLVFTGPPGTGKTTVARLLGQIYRALGILEKGHLIEAARQDLVAEYVGQTAVKTERLINQAMGGVLFIDEAYTLAPEEARNDFGREAIDTLLARIENDRDRFIVIVAGYTGEMTRFIRANPGLQSRFPRTIDFPDYSPGELLRILDAFAGGASYTLTPAARVRAAETIERLWARRDERFGNGRTVRNLFEQALSNQANRVELDASDAELSEIDACDIPAAG